ncbi:MAG: hypothetical protein V4671_00995 [Armatimonadota bacterium]
MANSTQFSRYFPVLIAAAAFCGGALLRLPNPAPAVAAPPRPADTSTPTRTWRKLSAGIGPNVFTWINMDLVETIQFTKSQGKESGLVNLTGRSSGVHTTNPDDIAFLRAYAQNRSMR